MQFAVAGFRYKGCKILKKRNKIKIAMFFIIIIFMITIIIVFLTLKNNDINNYTMAKKLYYISLSKTKNSEQTKDIQSKVKNVGGAGYVLNDNQINYVLGFGYFNKEDAVTVRDNNVSLFESCEVIERSFPTLKSKIKNQIFLLTEYKNVFKFICEAENDIYNLCILYEVAKINNNEVLNSLVKYTLLFQEFSNRIKAIKTSNLLILSIKDEFFTSLNIIVDIFSSAKASVYKGEDVGVCLKNLFLSMCETELYLRQNLNKI